MAHWRYVALLSTMCVLSAFAHPRREPSRQHARMVEPLLIDLGANGFQLTSVSDGVVFDLDGDGIEVQTAWTSKGGDDAFLALDTIGTGRIENGRKLLGGLHGGEFGFTTLQNLELAGHPSANASDAVITESDAIFSTLILWLDANHNGISEGDELRSLASAGVVRMYVGVTGIEQADAHGNMFRYGARALVKNRYGVPVDVEVRSVRLARHSR